MRELGATSDAEHEAVGRLAVSLGIDQVVVIGTAARPAYDGAVAALRAGTGTGTATGTGACPRRAEPVHVSDVDEASAWLSAHVRPGDVVLVKASRGARLDRVAEALLAGSGGGSGAS
jgi:UDP-N-acetylmuramoyl-tripeptide--D-alanyl-D-alanine ligase